MFGIFAVKKKSVIQLEILRKEKNKYKDIIIVNEKIVILKYVLCFVVVSTKFT